MLTANPRAHLSPKDLVRQLASEVQLLPGWSLNDKAFHASFAANRVYFDQAAKVHCAIRNFFLSQGHTLSDWQSITTNPKAFNRIWRQALGLPLDDAPPPLALRRVLPTF